jgi:hypothetical protein
MNINVLDPDLDLLDQYFMASLIQIRDYVNKTRTVHFFRGAIKITFVKGQISVSFCFILFLVKSADWSGNSISAGHSLLLVPFL